MADFNRVLAVNPQDADSCSRQGAVFLKQGQNDRAIADFNEAVERDPNFAKAYYNRGVAYYNKSLYDKAIGDFNKCLELDPTLAGAREADAVFIRSAPPEAKDQIEQAMKPSFLSLDAGRRK